jgi:hypothetical protein
MIALSVPSEIADSICCFIETLLFYVTKTCRKEQRSRGAEEQMDPENNNMAERSDTEHINVCTYCVQLS